jgi:hypothetical protein
MKVIKSEEGTVQITKERRKKINRLVFNVPQGMNGVQFSKFKDKQKKAIDKYEES